jgi:hypothetical protein
VRKRAVQHDAEKGQNEIAHDGAFRHFRLAENREVLKQVHQENPDEKQKITEIPSLLKIFSPLFYSLYIHNKLTHFFILFNHFLFSDRMLCDFVYEAQDA